ncbi:MAG: type II toxin-antitoxin system VapC family toxin [Deltaproteobacteria bacterium]|nr:type II toxin-antitoxin system VapC family toxin [Deltaproteobacteria bacterium]
MAITSDHTYAAGDLPNHHRDPFDRILIAQAMLEGLTILTQDAIFKKYPAPVLNI